jgi:hypothetical protein
MPLAAAVCLHTPTSTRAVPQIARYFSPYFSRCQPLANRRHRGLARRRSALVGVWPPIVETPESRRILRRGARHENPPDDEAVGEHVTIIVPRACRSAVEDESGAPRGIGHFLIIHSGMLASRQCLGLLQRYLVTGKRIFAPLRFFDHAVALHFRTARQVFPNGIMALLFSARPSNSWQRLASRLRVSGPGRCPRVPRSSASTSRGLLQAPWRL